MAVWVNSLEQPDTVARSGVDRDVWIALDVRDERGRLLASTTDVNQNNRLLIESASWSGTASMTGSRWSGSLSATVPTTVELKTLADRLATRLFDFFLFVRSVEAGTVERVQVASLVGRFPRVEGRTLSWQLAGPEALLASSPMPSPEPLGLGAIDTGPPIQRLAAASAARKLVRVINDKVRQLGGSELEGTWGEFGGDDEAADVWDEALGDEFVSGDAWSRVMQLVSSWGMVPFFERHGCFLIDPLRPVREFTGLSRHNVFGVRNVFDDSTTSALRFSSTAPDYQLLNYESHDDYAESRYVSPLQSSTMHRIETFPVLTGSEQKVTPPVGSAGGVPLPETKTETAPTSSTTAIIRKRLPMGSTVDDPSFVTVSPLWAQSVDLRSDCVASSVKAGVEGDVFRVERVGWRCGQSGSSPQQELTARKNSK